MKRSYRRKSAKMSGREFRNVFENLRLRQRKSLGRSSLVNPNKPNAGAGYAPRLSACLSVLGKDRLLRPSFPSTIGGRYSLAKTYYGTEQL